MAAAGLKPEGEVKKLFALNTRNKILYGLSKMVLCGLYRNTSKNP